MFISIISIIQNDENILVIEYVDIIKYYLL